MALETNIPVRSLYVHVPFCAKKCSYCAFYSESSDGDLINRFVSALIREFKIIADHVQPGTVFFGGGTPSILNMRQWELILSAMHDLGISASEEWTIESNPATVSVDKAKLWRDAGVNRVSMGVQSFDASLLERLGRIHDRRTVYKSFNNLRSAGIENINIDLMFGIPGQSMEVWQSTLKEAVELQSEHLSCYEVIYEEDTPLFEDLVNGEVVVDEDLNSRMYDELLERADGSGLTQYEVANFARDNPLKPRQATLAKSAVDRDSNWGEQPAFACRHNMNYWRGGSYHAVGPSAAGFIDGQRTKNVSNTELYCSKLERGERAMEWTETLPPIRRAGEIAAFGLRMNTGWKFEEFAQRTGFDLRDHWLSEMEEVIRLGWATKSEARFSLTNLGLRFADGAAQYFLR